MNSFFSGAMLARFLLISPALFLSLAVNSTNDPAANTLVRISAQDAKSTAASIEQQVPLNLAAGLKAELWASEKLLGDTVAIHVDDKGRVWAGITQRSNNSEFDIRGYADWEHPSVAFNSVEDRRAFLRRELAPEKSAHNKRIPDRNKDGSHDWRDLALVKEKVTRLEDTANTGRADLAQTVIEDFNTEVTDVIGGLFYHDLLDELFINVAPDFWRLKDTNNDGTMDSKTSLAHGFAVHIGFSGHGMSGAMLGPDGKMYYSMGDIGTNVTDRNGRNWNYANQGVIARSEVDGSNFEIFAAGLRNIYEFSFDQYGNFISVDNDGDHPGEYERVVHLIEGSDSGWRINWQLGKYKDPNNNSYKVWMDEGYYQPAFAGQAAHILPPVAPYHAGPTGMTYNPGSALSGQWANHFFVVEFNGTPARAGINAFSLQPKGASFTLASDKNLLRGILPTGLDFGPDGALYLSDWIEGWSLKQKGRVWKLDTLPNQLSDAEKNLRSETRRLLAQDLRSLQPRQLAALLNHSDMRVRQKAQFVLVEKQQKTVLENVAQTDTNQLARIHAIWGLGQLLRAPNVSSINNSTSKTLIALLQDSDAEVRAQAAKVLGDANTAAASDALIPLLADKNPRAILYATQALGRIGNHTSVAPLVAMLAANNDQDIYLRHAGAIALARIGDEAALGQLATHSSEAVRIAAVVALKQLHSAQLAKFLTDDSEFVVTNAARAINDDEFAIGALPALAKLLDQPRFINEPLLRRAINANVYATQFSATNSGSNSADNARRLIHFAQQKNIPASLRAEAIHALSVWASGSVYDRVTGMYRGPLEYPASDAIEAMLSGYSNLLADEKALVRTATINALGQLNIKNSRTKLVDLLTKNKSPDVRIAALHTLKKFNPPNLDKLVMQALKDRDSTVRMSALAMVPKLNLPAAQKVAMHSLLLNKGSIIEQQAALISLSAIDAAEAETVFAQQLKLLIAGKIAPEVQLDLLTAAQKINADEVKNLLAQYQQQKDPNKQLDMYREALYGGDAEKGRQLFRQSNTAQCVRCHKVGGSGANVGPELTRIASQLSREQLLEAMVDPSARVAPGFGPISGMPPMGLLLTPAELRDLVAYLTTLNEEVKEVH